MKITKKRKETFIKKTIQKKEDKFFAQEKFEKCITPERGSLDLADEKFWATQSFLGVFFFFLINFTNQQLDFEKKEKVRNRVNYKSKNLNKLLKYI